MSEPGRTVTSSRRRLSRNFAFQLRPFRPKTPFSASPSLPLPPYTLTSSRITPTTNMSSSNPTHEESTSAPSHSSSRGNLDMLQDRAPGFTSPTKRNAVAARRSMDYPAPDPTPPAAADAPPENSEGPGAGPTGDGHQLRPPSPPQSLEHGRESTKSNRTRMKQTKKKTKTILSFLRSGRKIHREVNLKPRIVRLKLSTSNRSPRSRTRLNIQRIRMNVLVSPDFTDWHCNAVGPERGLQLNIATYVCRKACHVSNTHLPV